MTSTTLVTFLLQTPRAVKSVQLLGSWDNFSKPYPMERDRRLGSGRWRGCHSFTDIICDGNTVEPLICKRDGGLLEGGRYWYFYRLDDDAEVHDETEPSTNQCPFLPGQRLNILEVPVEVKERRDPSRERSLSQTSIASSIVFTLKPEDKFQTPKPPTPSSRRISVEHQRPVTRCGSRSGPSTARIERAGGPPAAKRRCSALVSRPSTPLGASSIYSEPVFPVTERDVEPHTRPYTTGRFACGEYFSLVPNPFETSAVRDSWLKEPLFPEDPWMNQPSRAVAEDVHLEPAQVSNQRSASDITQDMAALVLSPLMSCPVRRPPPPPGTHSTIADPHEPTPAPVVDAARLPFPYDEPPARADSTFCALQHTDSVSSARTSGLWSSLTSGSGPALTHRFSQVSQPRTPQFAPTTGAVVVEAPAAEDDAFVLNASSLRRTASGFLGYSLDETEYSSALTIRNLETATSGAAKPDIDVAAWNDGHPQRSSALQELVDDLGYLGSMIA